MTILPNRSRVYTAVGEMQIKIVGPPNARLGEADLKRLFPGQRLTPARRRHLVQSALMIAECGDTVVGVAAYDRADGEVRIHELAVDAHCDCDLPQVVDSLLDAVELACLAGGGRRVVLLPRAANFGPLLSKRGYITVAEGCAGLWLEKALP